MSIHRIVLTGGPCAGKSTGLAVIEQRLKNLGYHVIIMDEMATNAINSRITPINIGGVDFQELLVRLQINRDRVYREMANKYFDKLVILYDRGILDGQAYCETPEVFRDILSSVGLKRQEVLSMYDGVFHLVTAADGAEEFYTVENNSARTETPEQAREKDKSTLNCWIGHPHLRVINNKDVNFEQKMNKLTCEILGLLGEPIPLEIERKFLIKMPELGEFVSKYNCNMTNIIQTYLVSEGNTERRIRQRGVVGDYSYYYTEKVEVCKGTREEREKIISEKEYINLMIEADTSKKQIKKRRYCFIYKDRYFEMDIYPFWEDRAILEIEVEDISEDISIPSDIEVIKEVTDDKAYRNSELASNTDVI